MCNDGKVSNSWCFISFAGECSKCAFSTWNGWFALHGQDYDILNGWQNQADWCNERLFTSNKTTGGLQDTSISATKYFYCFMGLYSISVIFYKR